MQKYSQTDIKRYIKKILTESADVTLPGDTSLTFELNKPLNRGYVMNQSEIEQVKTSLKQRDPSIQSVDYDMTKHEITFMRNTNDVNFYYKLRKTKNPLDQSGKSFIYVLWYIPFKEKEDINMPGKVSKKESSAFAQNFDSNNILNILGTFLQNALLMNI